MQTSPTAPTPPHPPAAAFILTAADVRAKIGLTSDRFDPLIEAGITTVGIELEARYSRSLRVGTAPENSRDYFLHRVEKWAASQPDLDGALAAERRRAARS